MIGTIEYMGKCPNCGHDIFADNKYEDKVNGLSADDLFTCPQCKQTYSIVEIEKAIETNSTSEVLSYLCDIMGCGELKIKEEGDDNL